MKKVIGIDQSKIIYKAKEIISKNKLDDVVILIKGKVEHVEIPFDKVKKKIINFYFYIIRLILLFLNGWVIFLYLNLC